jgi:hypothetical protein
MAVPVATLENRTLRINEWGQLKPWLTYLDGDGNPAVRYEFFDGGIVANGSYFWTPDNEHHAYATTFGVAAADLASVYVRGGAAARRPGWRRCGCAPSTAPSGAPGTRSR